MRVAYMGFYTYISSIIPSTKVSQVKIHKRDLT